LLIFLPGIIRFFLLFLSRLRLSVFFAFGSVLIRLTFLAFLLGVGFLRLWTILVALILPRFRFRLSVFLLRLIHVAIALTVIRFGLILIFELLVLLGLLFLFLLLSLGLLLLKFFPVDSRRLDG